jgi:phosphate:Na+ symporter
MRAERLCADAMRSAGAIAGEVVSPPDLAKSPRAMRAAAASTEPSLVQLERCAAELGELRRSSRSATLGAVANGTLTADAAIARLDTLRSIEALAHHAWRCAAHLVGRG